MILCKVVGVVVSTQKNKKFEGVKIFVVQPINPSGEPIGNTLISAEYENDAGIGDTVLVFTKGNASRLVVRDLSSPVDYAICGIVDRIEMSH
ncbi:MAG: EutN/CcmL family microcompartment protein [Candidatus Hydrogenedentota bacterium]